MKKKILKFLRREDGLSLIEVVASIVLLAIILLSFYYMFVQSAKTTRTSEDIIEATYIAQTEMEKLYTLTKGKSIPANFETKVFPEYGVGVKSQNSLKVYHFENETHKDIYIFLTVEAIGGNLTRVLIQVYDEKDGILKAQMETTVEWGP